MQRLVSHCAFDGEKGGEPKRKKIKIKIKKKQRYKKGKAPE